MVLSADEMIKLLKHFDISLGEIEQLSSGQLSMSAKRPQFIKNEKSLGNFLNQTIKEIELAQNIKHRLYYAASDIPIYYFFFSDILSRFKQIVWLRDTDYKRHKNYVLSDIGQSLIKKSKTLFLKQELLNTTEFWTENTITNLWIQIDFLKSQGVLNTAETQLIYADLHDLLDYLKDQLESPKLKKQIYLCNYLPKVNNGLLQSESGSRSFLSFAGTNYVTSSNIALALDLKKWFENQKYCAVLLNTDAIKREQFFRKMHNSLKKQRDR